MALSPSLAPHAEARAQRLSYLLARHHWKQAFPHIHAVGGNLAEVPAAKDRAAAIAVLAHHFIQAVEAELQAADIAHSAAQAA